ncbi:hypothetical protein B484DRAFT_391394, partial [Ochromonadaceae sp. CCMP2298]
MVALLLIFTVDRFLLLRRWAPVPMLDCEIANRLRAQSILAIALHMALTLSYIYSWPMEWMGIGQKTTLNHYRIATIAAMLVAAFVWIVHPLDIPYSTLKTPCYIPTVSYGSEKYLCSDIKNTRQSNWPSLIRPMPGDCDDICHYIPQ